VIRHSKQADERREAGPIECWCLHGAVGLAADWRSFAKRLGTAGTGSRAVDLWRFLQCEPLPLADFGAVLNADAGGETPCAGGRALLGYSMGGRLALHSLLEPDHPWQAAVIVSAHPGLETAAERESRRAADAVWATRALAGEWKAFLTDWNEQPLLACTAIRDPQANTALSMRRREIARSFVDWSLGSQEPLWSRLPEISIPVLWIAGENDAKYRVLAERAVALMPGARLAIAPAAGHRVPWDAEEWLATHVVTFLRTGVPTT
jgi:2-succinyl-6-hydroxy-2,4-cyclohexadiene-1-carboxylate synthase